ncbi:hypothetical protein PGTUg99_003245 [Puccinia graminis f. sp. tritici]|uniref:Uncharacterized protein n=1 Tax=Puccinia graminis f. sp. tritici TaxID=56615 RepID=A0A5B0RV45_PUCGR|nr:hypothetical protein PGTUg99_003245 [Puccinia graminis f. sp. tritici]
MLTRCGIMFITRHALLASFYALLAVMGYAGATLYLSDSTVTLEEQLVERRQPGEIVNKSHQIGRLLVKRKGRQPPKDPKETARFSALQLKKLKKKIDDQYNDLDDMVSGKLKFNAGIMNRRVDTIIRVQKRALGPRDKISIGFPTDEVKSTVKTVNTKQDVYLASFEQLRLAKDGQSLQKELLPVKQQRDEIVNLDQILIDATGAGP